MIVKNANVFIGTQFIRTDIKFEETIQTIGDMSQEHGIDASSLYVIPGMIDIHTHGAMGNDTCDASTAALSAMADYYLQNGVTSFCPTTMTYGEETLLKIMRAVGRHKGEKGASVVGINMEGPFISSQKKGAQSSEHIIPPDIVMFNRLNKASGNLIKLVDIAPEINGALEFIQEVTPEVKVSLAHSAADYDEAMMAFNNGATQVTHLFNAMQPFGHMAPGLVGAAMDTKVFVEIICDGIHLHPCVVRQVFKIFEEKTVLISDSMRCAGLGEGEYELGGQKVIVKGETPRLLDSTIAGSALNLHKAVKNAVKFGIDIEKAVYAATTAPATAIGIVDKLGCIKIGATADLVALDTNLDIVWVMKKGKFTR